ncbi:unnamed protein product [Adineta ricciae]|nr:unnamed protein product [Adineta ricciae]
MNRLERFVHILYLTFVTNNQPLTEKFPGQFREVFLRNQFFSQYALKMLDFLIKRNQIRLDSSIYDKLINLLQTSMDTNLLETLAIALENSSATAQLPVQPILKIIENNLQVKSSSAEIKYYSCLAIDSLLQYRITLSEATLNLLKTYARGDDTQSMINQSSKMSLREISLSILEKYFRVNEKVLPDDIEHMVNQEVSEKGLLDLNNPVTQLETAKQLLSSMVKSSKTSLSKSQIEILIICLTSPNSSRELKLTLLKICQLTPSNLNSALIQLIFKFIKDSQLAEVVIEIYKSLVDMKTLFPDEILISLIHFLSESSNEVFKESVIEGLKKIIAYQKNISKELLHQIELEILVKDPEKKTIFLEKCYQAVRNRQKLSRNIIQSLESLAKDMEGKVFEIIDLAIQNGQRFSFTFLHSISQEIFKSCEDNVDESLEIILRGTQDGNQLSSKMIESLKRILKNPNQQQLFTILKILSNEVKHTLALDIDIIRSLENLLQVHPLSVLHILKYLQSYQPSPEFITNLNRLSQEYFSDQQINAMFEEIANQPLQVNFHFMEILFTVEYIDEDIDKYSELYSFRHLLCNDLIMRTDPHNQCVMDQSEFEVNLSNIERLFSWESCSFERDDFLMFLIREFSTLSLRTINSILLLLKSGPEALRALFKTSSLRNLQIHWLNSIIDRSSYIKLNETVKLDGDQADKIIDLLFAKLEFSVSLSESFLQRIYGIEDWNQLIEFLNLIFEKKFSEKINFNEYFTRHDSEEIIATNLYFWMMDIKCDFIRNSIAILCEEHQINKPTTLENLSSVILTILLRNWPFEVFERLIELLKSSRDQTFELTVENCIEALFVINNFALVNDHVIKIESIFQSQKSNDWPVLIHQYAVSALFNQQDCEKTLKELLSEIKNGQELSLSTETLEQTYREIVSIYNNDSKVHPIGKAINNWDETDVKKWSMTYKASAEKPTNEAICVIKRAVFLHNSKQSIEPRTIQILSLLLLLHESEGKNKRIARLAQIKTGEGKSLIIAMFAAIKALHGHQVDIITTSPLLAERDAKSKKTFYNMLHLTVGDNNGIASQKPCYKDDVVYGSVENFQFDVLRDEYSLLETRFQRQFDIAIVDEVDSMFIDGNSSFCYLASKTLVIDELQIIFVLIWQELNRTCERLVRIDDKLYCITVPFRRDHNGEITLLKPEQSTAIDVGGQDSAKAEDYFEVEDEYTFIENHITDYVENMLLKPNKKNECLIYIPKHLISFVSQQIRKWIYSAWQAKFVLQENRQYLISEGDNGNKSIIPIDYQSTGIIQTNSTWSGGLQQFLDIKHQLRIHPANLTTNFLSNVAFFSKYKHLFGLTGTLGGQESKNIIQHIYNVDFVVIPPYKHTQFVAYPDQVRFSEDAWLNECVRSVYIESKIQQRAVLVICETRLDAMQIRKTLIEKDKQLERMIKLYTRSDNDERRAVEYVLDCGEIIIATNLAGRGTDIETTHNVERNGGLHVLLTFLPMNTRVEQQAFGRTSRQGKRGTAQLIVLSLVPNETSDGHVQALKKTRDEKEQSQIERTKSIDLKRIRQRDALFQKFCNFLKELREKENDKWKLRSVEELWAFWLETIEDLNDDSIQKSFEEFRTRISNDYSSDAIFHNPFYLISKGLACLSKKRYEKAINCLRTAVKLDLVYTVAARYNLAYALMVKSKKEEAKVELREALRIIENIFLPQQETMLVSLKVHQDATSNSDVENQIMNRLNLLFLSKNHIEQAITVLEVAESKKHNIRLRRKSLEEFFSEIDHLKLDIEQFKESGFVAYFQLTTREPTPWLSIITVAMIGLAQAAAGAALIVFTSGAAANIGVMLLSEGAGDMILAIKSAVTGEFNWKQYGIHKAISVTVTVATCGMAALKETGLAIRSGMKGASNVIRAGKIVGQQSIGQYNREGFKLLGMKMVETFAKQGTKELLITAVDQTVLAALNEKINKEFSDAIREKIKNEVYGNQTIDQLCVLADNSEQVIEGLARQILYNTRDEFVGVVKEIAVGILGQVTKGTSTIAIQVITGGKCLYDLLQCCNKFVVKLRNELEKLKHRLTIDNSLKTNLEDINKEQLKEIMDSLKKNGYLSEDNSQVLKRLQSSIFRSKNNPINNDRIIKICNDVYDRAMNKPQIELKKNLITKVLTDEVANYMTSRLNAELIKPVAHIAINIAVDKWSSEMERILASKKGTLTERIENRRNFNKIIQARDDAQNRSNEPIDPYIAELANSVENGASGDIMDIIAISDNLQCPIKVFRNGTFDLTIGEEYRGKQLSVNFQEGERGNIGHYTNMNSAVHTTSTGRYNCLFDVLSAQTNMDSNELRQMKLNEAKKHPDRYQKMLRSRNSFRQDQKNNLIYIGGKENKISETERLAGRLDIILQSIENSKIKVTNKQILELIKHDITTEDTKKGIYGNKYAKKLFHSSIIHRLAEFEKQNSDLFSKQLSRGEPSYDIVAQFYLLQNSWKSEVTPMDMPDYHYSQLNVNAKFSSCSTDAAKAYLPGGLREKIADKWIKTEGTQAIQEMGPASFPLRYFTHKGRLVSIDNRMLLAHQLSGFTPHRIVPSVPIESEKNRVHNPGIPTTTQPKYDKNINTEH